MGKSRVAIMGYPGYNVVFKDAWLLHVWFYPYYDYYNFYN